MTLFPPKITYFLELSVGGNSTASSEPDLNQRRKDYCQILISHYSPPLYQPIYPWNLIVEMTFFPYKICYFSKLLLENSTACTHPDFNQRHKDYSHIFISRYSPRLYELSYQWNLSHSDSSIEMTLIPCKSAFFFKLLVETLLHPLSRICTSDLRITVKF